MHAVKKKSIFAIVIATGFGAGYWPWGPGTAGAVVATVLWFVLREVALLSEQCLTSLAVILCFTILGTWATSKVQPFWGDDPSKVVIDEMVGVWVPLLFATSWQEALVALVLFRFFDIVKPLGIRQLDRRKGAFWVMADDLLAGVYSAIVLCLIKWCVWGS